MKKTLVLLLALMLVFALTACDTNSQGEPSEQPTTGAEPTPAPTAQHMVYVFSIAVDGAEDATEFNQDHYNDMQIQTVTLSIEKNGETKEYVCTGVTFSDVLASLGVSECESVTVIAADYEKTYSWDVIQEDTTFFAVEVNGETEGCPETFAASQGSSFSVKNVIQIIIQ